VCEARTFSTRLALDQDADSAGACSVAETEAMTRENDRRSDSPATPETPPTLDIATLEAAAESLSRSGDLPNAVALWAIALRLRMGATDAVT
jgi:hypothetical protein